MTSDQAGSAKNFLLPAEVSVYANALATTIAKAGGPDPSRLWALYRIFASLTAPPNTRQEAVWRAFRERAEVGSVAVPAASEARQALAADALRVVSPAPGSPLPDSITPLIRSLNINAEQVEVLRSWIDWENALLRRIGEGDAAVAAHEYPLEIAKRAAAVGIPLSALYFSGSVIGFSAVGLTSGLATIGGASGLVPLGLNPMTAGIAALIVGGITIKKILDVVSTGGGSRLQKKELEAQVNEITRLRQTALEYLSADGASMERGPWWEILTFRRGRRRAIVKLLHEARDRQSPQ